MRLSFKSNNGINVKFKNNNLIKVLFKEFITNIIQDVFSTPQKNCIFPAAIGNDVKVNGDLEAIEKGYSDYLTLATNAYLQYQINLLNNTTLKFNVFKNSVFGVVNIYLSINNILIFNHYKLSINHVGAITLSKYINNVSTNLFRSENGAVQINALNSIEVQINNSTFNLIVNSVLIATVTDVSITQTDFVIITLASGNAYMYNFNLINFKNLIGTKTIDRSFGIIDNTDGYGNELEIPANVVSDSGNTFDGIAGLENGATYEQIAALEGAEKTNKYVTRLIINA